MALSCADVMLLGAIGTRVEWEVLGYAADVATIGGARWKKPAWATLGAVMAGLLTMAAGASAELHMSGVVLWLWACGCGPVAVLGRRLGQASWWRADGVLWRWTGLGLASVWQYRPRRALGTGQAATCIPAAERFEMIDAAYPLWRRTSQWGGLRVLPWQMQKDSKPHVIYIVMESMGAMDTGCIGGKLGSTPCFDAWSARGALYTRHYAPGHSTSRSLMAALYGILPGLRARPTTLAENPAYLSGLPQLLSAQGYATLYLQGATLSFDDKASFFQTRGFNEVYGSEYLLARYPGAERGAWDAPHDQYLFDAHLAWLQQQVQLSKPTFSTLLTISNHEPWEVPRAWRPAHLQNDASYAANMASRESTLARERSVLAQRYADAQLGAYLDRLDKAGILGNAIVLISGDTGQQYEQGQISTQIGGYLRDEAYHIPLLVLAPQFLKSPKRFSHLSSQIDVQPTVMDLMGLQGPHHGMGQSLVRQPQRQSVHMTQPHQPAYLALRQQTWRFNVRLNGSSPSLFDVERDPQEIDDVAEHHPDVVAHLKRKALAMQDMAARLHQHHAFCPPAQATAHTRTTQLAQASYVFAPDGLVAPPSLPALAAMMEDTRWAAYPEMVHYFGMGKRVLRSKLEDTRKLELMQLRLIQTYPDSFGELDWLQLRDYHSLHDAFVEGEQAQEADVLAQVQAALSNTLRLK